MIATVKANVSYGEKDSLGYGNAPLFLQAGIGVGYDSNLYDSQTIEKSSHYYTPNFKIGINHNNEILGFTTFYSHDSFIPDNQNDATHENIVSFNSYWSPSGKNLFSLDALFNYSVERRGDGLTEDNPFAISNLDKYSDKRVQLGYEFKSAATNSLFFSLGHFEDDKIYESKRTEALDANFNQYGSNAILGYIWQKGRQIAVVTRNIVNDYPDASTASKNAKHQIKYTALNWSFSESTKLSFALGNDEKIFKSTNENRKTDYWRTSLNWEPLLHTQFSLKAGNEQRPATRINQTFNEVNNFSFSWRHVWSIDYATVLELAKTETTSVISNNEQIDKDLLLSWKTFYKDFELSLNLEKNTDGATSDNLSQFEIQLAYYFERGL